MNIAYHTSSPKGEGFPPSPKGTLKYNKFYIGLTRNGLSDNFIAFKPFKKYVDIHVRVNNLSNETVEHLENEHGLTFDWKDSPRWGKYRIRIHNKKHWEDKRSAIEILFKEAGGYKASSITEAT